MTATDGQDVREATDDQTFRPHARLSALVSGFRVSQSLYVAAKLGIADLLSARPQTAAELAAETGAHAPTLHRILRALASVGVFAEDDDGSFNLTTMSACLRTDAPLSLRFQTINQVRPATWQAWGALLHSAMTGESAFRHVHGVGWWDYLEQHSEDRRIFDAGMQDTARALAAAVVEAYDFSEARCVVDVGGGRGELLATILSTNPAMRGILFDQPDVVKDTSRVLSTEAVAARCATVAGSFFERVPHGGDIYMLQHILHDWKDDDAVRILRVCREATSRSSRILLSERLIGRENDAQPVKFGDLMMLVAFDGARERTPDEYANLLAQARFQLARIIPTQSDHSLIEAVPV